MDRRTIRCGRALKVKKFAADIVRFGKLILGEFFIRSGQSSLLCTPNGTLIKQLNRPLATHHAANYKQWTTSALFLLVPYLFPSH